MIEILSTDLSGDGIVNGIVIIDNNTQDTIIKSKLISILWNIIHQCSNKIFEVKLNQLIIYFISIE